MQISKMGRTILVVEDEMEVRGYLEMALKCMGHSVELAQDGDEALAYLRSSNTEVAAVSTCFEKFAAWVRASP
jgi:DNA-binding NtrC family response regulator